MYGYHDAAMMDLPQWANHLRNCYQRLRAERRNATKRRYWYRAIEKEKLRLVELGIEFEAVDLVCKYLVSLKQVNADRLQVLLMGESKQLSFNFFTSSI